MRHAVVLGISIASMTLLAPSAVAQNDFYVFGTIGNTDTNADLGGQNRIDDDESSFTVGGGYKFSEKISLEAAYEDFGTHAAQTNCPPDFFCLAIPLITEADASALSVSLVGSFRISDVLDGYGRVGITSWDLGFEGISSAFDDSGEDLHYGIGLRRSFEDHWKVFAEYTEVNLDIDTIRVGLRFDF